MTDATPNPIAPEPQPALPPVPELPPVPARPPSSTDTRARRPDYRGAELDPERGPGLGCFWFQVIVLGFFIVLIPIGLNLDWPFELLAILLFVVIGLLLLTGQSVIFLLRLVAADRRAQGRRRPLASPTKTVGELEDEHTVAHAVGGVRPVAAHVLPTAGEPAVDGAPASQAMIRDDEARGAPAVGAQGTDSEGEPGTDADATGADAGARAPARTMEGDAAVPGDTAGDREAPLPARMHESSPDGRHQGPAAAEPTADVPPTAEPAADAESPSIDAAPGEPPEGPDPGVRQ